MAPMRRAPRMRLPELLIFLAHWGVTRAGQGKFWHVSDLHLDPDYKVSEDPLQVCPSAGSQPVPNAGPWGNYLCDSPWILINSSIYAMKEIEPEPDFILWTGDDTPHVPNENLGEVAVLQIVERLTELIREAFPDTKVYAALGNHDFHPKNQFPAGSNNIYNQVAELWRPWLSNESIALFKEGAFYSEKLPGPSAAGRIVVLNTNLYYSNNEQTAGMADPGQQFQWLDDVLTNASRAGEMVYIIGHVPPGFFEKTRNKAWFREGPNQEYLKVVRKHHRVIAGQFFGHHHTDSFRMFYDDAGAPISVMFLTPGVTPWKTTLPGVVNGANNPGIRVFEYDRATLSLQEEQILEEDQKPGFPVNFGMSKWHPGENAEGRDSWVFKLEFQKADMVTYFLNLSQANAQGAPRWELEYRVTKAYGVPDAGARSMHAALGRIASDHGALQRYYVYNSVSYDTRACDEACQAEHVCALREVAFDGYAACLRAPGVAPAPRLELLLVALLGLRTLLVPRPWEPPADWLGSPSSW
ncbi:acid sphingomyelinase-like phosphodiesterase 3b isoform X1 [Physeter macrocephalus]|uniref:Acid sphingomyelinase-like phosphodiesterase 3b n=1 Tax=Physeter macrocephalus TaxID=9755 RepID=A0A455AX13_PHYMC|nr:acid sphingomyelinase-like phosphodiesterase 3b isoform X1 [Physeter catodon]|eukprot:XP_028340418.1 acid sphingomyelinase-like phosphodiesterase 3b isoform X1 [Physeter catodon]